MTENKNLIELKATGVRFFSPCDESAFLEWLKKVPSVGEVEGRGLTLHISIDASVVDEDGLRELLSLFRRYGVDLSQLVAFDREDFSEWFRSSGTYWHKEVFG